MIDDDAMVVAEALDGSARSVAQLVRIFEDVRPEAARRRGVVLAELDAAGTREAPTLGITGTPGSGKSSIVARVVSDLLQTTEVRIGVLAIDPSSPISGGSLLGDRTRMRPGQTGPRLFFRSQASATELGGLSPSSFQVSRLMSRLFDVVLVETVGIGQSEADIRHLASRVYLVVQPLGGDEVQFLKAGIIEVPDVFLVNKIDLPGAVTSLNHLRGSLGLARPFDESPPPVIGLSARTGEGFEDLLTDVTSHLGENNEAGLQRDQYFLERWVDDEWGRQGRMYLHSVLGGALGQMAHHGSFDLAQADFDASIRALLAAQHDR